MQMDPAASAIRSRMWWDFTTTPPTAIDPRPLSQWTVHELRVIFDDHPDPSIAYAARDEVAHRGWWL